MLNICMSLCTWQIVFALPQLPDAIDRPTQRWLPAPQGDGTDLSQQAQLLQQLRDLMSSDSETKTGNSPPSKLSEQQLREMEKALEDMRELIGKDKLPDLESIPKEWIDQALTDPVLRKQAQQLLEQYLRDRKLRPPSNRTPLNSDGIPFPRRPTSEQTSPKSSSRQVPRSPSSTNSNTPSEPSATRPRNAPTSNDDFPTLRAPRDLSSGRGELEGQAPKPRSQNRSSIEEQTGSPNQSLSDQRQTDDSTGPSMAPPTSARPDADRIEALQELFKKLKTIQGQSQTDRSSSSKNPGEKNTIEPKSASPGKPNTGNNSRAIRPNTLGGQPNTATPRSSRNSPKKPLSDDSPNQPTLPKPADKPSGELANDPFDPSLFSQPESANSTESTSNSNSNKSSANPNPLEKPKLPSGQPSRLGPSSGRSQNANPQSTNRSNTSRNDSAGDFLPDVDVKTQLERHGLGRALQSIVQKTMKEQGASNAANGNATEKGVPQSNAKDSRSPNQAKPSNQAGAVANRPAKNNQTPQSSEGIAKTNAGGGVQSTQPSNSPNPNTSSTMSGVRDIASQFWGAIRSTPAPANSGSSASSPSTVGGLGGLTFDWSSTIWLLFAFGLLAIAMLLLLARKRIVQATAAKEAEAELAKVILTEGIRTRADVVRAFHRFVLRRAQPVANWWNHRYVTSKLTEASPQLRSVLSDLASVYEHARYLPPDVSLTSEELDRVQAALKQCATSGV